VQQIVSAYWDLVLAQRQIAITEASLALARERLRITEIGAQGGKIAKAEIPAVQQIIATREEEVLGGELAVLERSIALRRAVGMELGPGELGLRVATELETEDKNWTIGPLLERAYAASPELAQLAKQDQSATIEIEVTENGLLPRLDLALSFGPTGTAGTDDAFTTAAKNLAKFNELQVQGSLTFEQALRRDDVRGRSRELRQGREKLRVTAADIKLQIAQSMARAIAQIELAKRRVVLSQRAIDLAIENIRIETDRFNLGKSTNFDVLNRLEEQRQAELRKAQAMIDWHKAETVVLALTGDLLPAFGISVE
jgi:outer membrane protein TolC